MARPADTDLRRALPSVDQVLQQPHVQPLVELFGRAAVLRQLRRLLDEARERAATGDEAGLRAGLEGLIGRLAEGVQGAAAPSLIPVINATGVVVHTNLGRAPLSRAAAARVAAIASSYSNLELDL